MRELYAHADPDLALEWVTQLGHDLQDADYSLGRTLIRWRNEIAAWHRARVTNGPTEAVILWSGQKGVHHVDDEAGITCRRHVLWSDVVDIHHVDRAMG